MAFRVSAPQGKRGGGKDHRWRRRGTLFFSPQPCHVTTGLVVGAAQCVLVHGPAVQLRTGAAAQRLPWICWRGRRTLFGPTAGVLDHLGGSAQLLPALLPLTAL